VSDDVRAVLGVACGRRVVLLADRVVADGVVGDVEVAARNGGVVVEDEIVADVVPAHLECRRAEEAHERRVARHDPIVGDRVCRFALLRAVVADPEPEGDRTVREPEVVADRQPDLEESTDDFPGSPAS
jgi:hypothetical protein